MLCKSTGIGIRKKSKVYTQTGQTSSSLHTTQESISLQTTLISSALLFTTQAGKRFTANYPGKPFSPCYWETVDNCERHLNLDNSQYNGCMYTLGTHKVGTTEKPSRGQPRNQTERTTEKPNREDNRETK